MDIIKQKLFFDQKIVAKNSDLVSGKTYLFNKAIENFDTLPINNYYFYIPWISIINKSEKPTSKKLDFSDEKYWFVCKVATKITSIKNTILRLKTEKEDKMWE